MGGIFAPNRRCGFACGTSSRLAVRPSFGFRARTARLVAVCFALAMIAASCGPATAQRNGLLQGTLPNGLSYFLDPAEPQDGKITFKLIVKVGEENSLPDEQSVAHVVEHLVFAGANDANNVGSLRSRVERFGGVWGNDANAATGANSTSYYVKLPAAQAGTLNVGVDILQNWIAPRAFSDAEIDRETKAVIEERRRGLTDAALNRTAAQLRTWFPGHPHYDFTPDPIGYLSATPATIRHLYRDYYTPTNMAVIIHGDFDPGMMLNLLASRVGTIPKGNPNPPRASPAPLSVEAGHYKTIASDGPSETRIELTYKYRLTPMGSENNARMKAIGLIVDRAAAPILAGLAERYRAPNRAVGMQSESSYTFPGISMVTLSATGKPGATREGLSELLETAAALRRDGLSRVDVEAARSVVVAELEARAPDAVGRLETYYLEGSFDPQVKDIATFARRLPVDEVNAQLARWLDPANRDIFIFHPRAADAAIPTQAEVAVLVRNAGKARKLTMPAPRDPIFAPASRENVTTASGQDEAGGYTRWSLPRSGATLLYRQTDQPDIGITALRRGGRGRFNQADRPLAVLAVDLAARSGLAGLDAFEFGRFTLARGITLTPFLTPDREGLRAHAPRGEWPVLLDLVRAQILRPQCSAEALDDLRRDRLLQENVEVEIAENDAFQAMIGDALGDPPIKIGGARLRAVSAAELCRRYLSARNTQDMVIAAEGPLDASTAYRSIASLLDLPGRAAPRVPSPIAEQRNAGADTAPPSPTKAGRDVLRIGSRKAGAVYLVMRWPPTENEQAGAIVAEIMSQRLSNRLRAVEMGTYDAHVSFAPEAAVFSIGFDTAPENVERMIAATKDELRKLRLGASLEEIANARAQMRPEPLSPSSAAEIWLTRGTLAPFAPATDAAVSAWIDRNIDLARLHEFVRLPAE